MKPSLTVPASGRIEAKPVLGGPATDRATLTAIAHQAMIERGLEPDFPLAAQKELAAIVGRPRRRVTSASCATDFGRPLTTTTPAILTNLLSPNRCQAGRSEFLWRSRTWTLWCAKARRSTPTQREIRLPFTRPPRFSPCCQKLSPPI